MRRVGLFLGVEPDAGGMFQYAQSLLDALRTFPRDQYEVQVACASEAWKPILADYAFPVSYLAQGRRGIRLANLFMVLQLPVRFAGALLSLCCTVPRQMRALSCDVWIFPAQDAIAWQAGVPFIATIHDLMHRYEPHFPEVAGWRRRAIRDHRFSRLAKLSRTVLVDSQVGKQHVMESYGTPFDKIFSLPYIAPRHIYEAKDSAGFEKRYRLPEKFLFYPAQFWAHKNHARLIGALAQARQHCPDMALVLTGSPRHEYPRIAALVERLGLAGCVHFMGYVPDADLAGFYRRARALVMPTFFGPTNIPPLEALACGCPAAVSGIYGMPEQLGEAALYFDPKDQSSIVNTIMQLWQDDALCSRLVTLGRARIESAGPAAFAQALNKAVDYAIVARP